MWLICSGSPSLPMARLALGGTLIYHDRAAVRRVLLRETRGFLHEAEAAIHLFATSRRGGTRSGMRSTPPISRGRLATEIAKLLRGKHKPQLPRTSTPAISSSWSTPPGWLSPRARANRRSTTATGLPGRVARGVVRALGQAAPRSGYRTGGARMLPKNRLGRAMLRKLKVYAGPDHPHQAQRPQPHAVDLRKVEA